MTQPAPTRKHAVAEEARRATESAIPPEEETEAEAGEHAEAGEGGSGGGESAGTVIVAGLVNLAIAAAKFVGGMISHSSAMLSEAAHSLADTVTEVLLFIALKRGNRPADDRHPFGYGRETYFWAFLAALCTFALGAGFSIWQGVDTIRHGEDQGSALARANVSLLIGQAVPEELERDLRAEIAAMDQVDAVPFLLTDVVGPGRLLVAAKVDFADDATVADIERAADEAERRLVARHPG